MKFLLVLIAVLVLGSSLHAQPNTVTTPPCNDPACTGAPFNYMFCDPLTGKRVNKCSTDPNNEPGLKVIKRSLPLVLCPDLYIDGLYNNVEFPLSPDPLDPHNVPVFINDHMVDRLNEAAAKWASLCPGEGPNREYDGSCCLEVVWSTGDAQMGKNEGDLENAAAATYIGTYKSDPTAPQNCQTNCGTSRMYINQQRRHTGLDEAGRPKFFLITEPDALGAIPPISQNYHYIDAYSMFLHELGHWLGFNHTAEEDANGDLCYHQGIMDASDYPDGWSLGRRDLSPDDVCMFKKLYCCESTKAGVEEEPTQALSFAVLPNPARDMITLILQADLPRRPLTVRLVDARGAVVREVHRMESTGEIAIDLAGIANGIYMLTLSNGLRTHGEKIVVQR
ncbi:MAG: T9SS type A sorting domain-containing protein [Bacteroidetes bacterium]|nr:T9SS type A sorting domain-containing protein [Bacteroidota bacterium]